MDGKCAIDNMPREEYSLSKTWLNIIMILSLRVILEDRVGGTGVSVAAS